MFTLTNEQQTTVDLIHTNQSVAVQAYAGASKTTTAKEACKGLKDAVYICFNKHNVVEAKSEGLNATCVTSHSMGYRGINTGSGLSINEDKSATIFRTLNLKGPLITFQNMWNAIRLHNLPAHELSIDTVFDYIEGTPHDTWYDNIEAVSAVNTEIYREKGTIDYVDMLHLPAIVRPKGWLKCSHIIVDEFQDTSECAIHMIKHAVSPNVPIIVLGDTNQRIFNFAHCSPDAFAHTTEWQQATLSTSFRCPEAVIDVAKWAVPEINAFKSGGTASHTDDLSSNLTSGSLVLGTKYAYILPEYFTRAFNGDSVALRGSDVLHKVSDLLKKASKVLTEYHSAVNFVRTDLADKLSNLPYTAGTQERRNTLDSMIQALDCAARFFSSTAEFIDFVKKAERMGKRRADVTFSTIHRAKGSESTDVYLLQAQELVDTMGQDDYARRLFYVGVTRSQENLTLVA
jgi:UvrD-like helicase C-terminal domain